MIGKVDTHTSKWEDGFFTRRLREQKSSDVTDYIILYGTADVPVLEALTGLYDDNRGLLIDDSTKQG